MYQAQFERLCRFRHGVYRHPEIGNAIIVGLGRLNATNELTVMRACGAGGARVLRPLLMLCLLLASGVAALSLVARPWAYGHMYALKEGAEAASELNRIKPQRFYLYEDGTISYEEAMRNADSKNELRLRIKLESKRDSSIADQQSESLRIMEEDSAQTF